MSDGMDPQMWTNLQNAVSKQAVIHCPECEAELAATVFAEFKPTVLTMEIHIEDGHMLQAATVGGVLTNLATLLRATAKHLGGKVEVLVKDIRVSATKVAIDVMVANVKESAVRQEKA